MTRVINPSPYQYLAIKQYSVAACKYRPVVEVSFAAAAAFPLVAAGSKIKKWIEVDNTPDPFHLNLLLS